MHISKQLSVVLAIAVMSFASTSSGQESGKALLKECLRAQAQEFVPLTQERDAVYREFNDRSSSIRNVLLWLEEDHETADQQRLQRIAALETQLKTLKEYANLTSVEATNDVAATEESANAILEDIETERDSAVKPVARQLAVLQRKYKAKEIMLKPVLMKLFREKGDSGPTASLIKSFGSFSYSSGTANATYKRESDNDSAAIFYIYLVNDKVAQKKYGMFRDKYPVVFRSKHQLEILVGRARVTIYSSDHELDNKRLGSTLSSLVDIEKLETMLTP